MKMVVVFFTLVFGLIFGIQTVLHNGKLINYLDTHPDPDKVPPALFYIGEGYYIFRNLQNAATYYQRVSDNYPQSKYADDAYFNYLQALNEIGEIPRPQMAEIYATYLERFPNGQHTDIVQKQIEYNRNNR